MLNLNYCFFVIFIFPVKCEKMAKCHKIRCHTLFRLYLKSSEFCPYFSIFCPLCVGRAHVAILWIVWRTWSLMKSTWALTRDLKLNLPFSILIPSVSQDCSLQPLFTFTCLKDSCSFFMNCLKSYIHFIKGHMSPTDT